MFRILLAILISITPTLGYAQTSSKTLGGNYPSGFSGFRNYAKNPGGEIDAQNVSVAGTNGTIGVFSNNPITNKKSFRVGGDLNTNITATFNFDTFDQGLADSSNNCAAALNLQPNGVGTYTINVKLGSTTVATKAFTTTSGLPVQYHTFVFSCGVLGQVPTIDVVANLTSGSGTDHFQADDFYMGQDPGFVQSMKISTQEQTYTPTYTGFGTVSTSNMKWYQDGAYLYVYGSFIPGTTTGTEARLSLPTGYTAVSTISTIMLCGDVGRGTSNTTYFRSGVLCEPNVSYVTFSSQTSASDLTTKALGNGLVASGQLMIVNAKIPISGASNINATTSQCLQDGSCVNVFSAKISSAGVVSGESIDFISGNCGVSGTSIYTCTFLASMFPVAPTCVVTAETSQVSWNAGSPTTASAIFTTTNSGGTATAGASQLVCTRAGSDQKPVMQAPWVSGSVTSNSTGPLRVETMTGVCSSGSSVLRQSTTSLFSVANISSGGCAVTYPSTTWASAPSCVIGGSNTSTVAAGINIQTDPSTTTLTTYGFTTTSGAALTAYGFSLTCTAPRN